MIGAIPTNLDCFLSFRCGQRVIRIDRRFSYLGRSTTEIILRRVHRGQARACPCSLDPQRRRGRRSAGNWRKATLNNWSSGEIAVSPIVRLPTHKCKCAERETVEASGECTCTRRLTSPNNETVLAWRCGCHEPSKQTRLLWSCRGCKSFTRGVCRDVTQVARWQAQCRSQGVKADAASLGHVMGERGGTGEEVSDPTKKGDLEPSASACRCRVTKDQRSLWQKDALDNIKTTTWSQSWQEQREVTTPWPSAWQKGQQEEQGFWNWLLSLFLSIFD